MAVPVASYSGCTGLSIRHGVPLGFFQHVITGSLMIREGWLTGTYVFPESLSLTEATGGLEKG